MKKFLFAFTALMISASVIYAQTDAAAPTTSGSRNQMPKARDYNTWTLGLHFGPTIFSGDIADDAFNGDNFATSLAYGLALTKNISHTFGIQGHLLMGKLEGTNTMSTVEWSFESDIMYQASLRAVLTLGNVSWQKRKNVFHFYLAAGLGTMSFDAKNYKKELSPVPDASPKLNSESDGNTATVIPFAVGGKYKLGKKLDLHLEYNYNITNTDYLDALNVILSNPHDSYSYINLGITYKFGKKDNYIEWVNPMETIYTDINDMKDKMDALTGDKDKDGVADIFDKDGSTPEGTKVYGDGTSVDIDGDGVSDSKDADPFTNKGAVVDASGKEADADGDGVTDSQDMEPGTPSGQLVNFQGKTIKITSSGGGGEVAYWPSVYFNLNSSKIMSGSNSSVATVAMMLKSNTDLKVNITGNADKTGSEKFNTELGQKRADTVKDVLVNQYGIDASRLTTATKGKSDLLNSKTNSVNRRVDFSVVK
ncbi:MAG TPA: OmpA family protein [Bacteroidia bacterium]|nr:OmpA family protein [Bacteroidia bacterium]